MGSLEERGASMLKLNTSILAVQQNQTRLAGDREIHPDCRLI